MDWKNLPLLAPDARIGACVSGVGKFICSGLNYADHAAESGMDIRSEPVMFMKATSAICGPNDGIVNPLPEWAIKRHTEVRLSRVFPPL